MGFKGITINTPKEAESHIFAEDDAAIWQGILGKGSFLLDYGKNFETKITGSNTIRVESGMVVNQGHIGLLPLNDFETFTLQNGTAGETRNDLLVATYETTGLHAISTYKLEVITDMAKTTLAEDVLVNNGKKAQVALAMITMTGMALSKVTRLINPVPDMHTMLTMINDAPKIYNGYDIPSPSLGKDGDIYIRMKR